MSTGNGHQPQAATTAPQTPSTQGNGRHYKGRKRGPKTKWGKVDPLKVAALAGKLGATESQLAAALGVTTQTLRNWKSEKKKLFCLLNAEKAKADNEVVKSLFRRAKGYSHKAVKIMSEDGKLKKVPYVERYPPDTTACIFWLKNRDPERWRDRADHTIANPDGTNVQGGTTVIAPTVVFVQPKKEMVEHPVIEIANGNGEAHE